MIEGPLPRERTLSPEESPFGFHPASSREQGYRYAEEIGVDWDRTGLYLMWVLGQPDIEEPEYDWEVYDEYFRELPAGILPMKNTTVANDRMVERSGEADRRKEGVRRAVDVSPYLQGTTYLPSDVEAYSRWVRSAVERYDGDGVEDMPGLKSPVKYWQVDNEPPRGREGYPDLLRVTSGAIKEADPDARVLIGGLVAPYGYMLGRYERDSLPILEELGGEGADVIDFHWFGLAGEWRYIPEAVARAREDLEKNGFGDAPIWITETGTYSGSPSGRKDRRLPRQSEREQASEMIKRYAVALGEGVEKIFWAWGMVEGFQSTRDNDFFDNTGFVYDGLGPGDRGEGTRKLIYWSYQKMTELLGFWDGATPEELVVADDVKALRFPFGGEDGRGLLVMWLSVTED